jgi:hypothetical protein
MHASLRREVHSKVSGAGRARRSPAAQALETGSQDPCHLGEAFLGGHEIRAQRIATRKAVIETTGTDTGLPVHPAATA